MPKTTNKSILRLCVAFIILSIMAVALSACSNKVTITFDAQGGTMPTAVDQRKGDSAQEPPISTKEGHEFLGWFYDKDCTIPFDAGASVKKSITLYAGWQKNEYTLTFVTQGTKVDPLTTLFDKQITLYQSYQSGHEFVGWFDITGTTMYDLSRMPAQNLTLYAVFNVSKGYTLFDFELNDTGYTLTKIVNANIYSLEIPDSFGNLPVTAIADEAAKGLSYVNEITVPSTVTSIGKSAFESCQSLKEIILPQISTISDKAFAGCIGLTTVNIPSTVTSIGESAFENCTSLAELDISNVSKSIGSKAFFGCENLNNITFHRSINIISDYTFYGCKQLSTLNMPASLTAIGDGAFSMCVSLNEIALNGNIKQIGKYAFALSGLSSVELPVKLTKISDYLFYNCGNLASVAMGNSITEIGNHAFADVTNLNGSGLTLSQQLNSIGRNAFEGCVMLDYINLPKLVTVVEDGAFRTSGLRQITLGSVTKIKPYTFYQCEFLVDISLTNVTEIGDFAFAECSLFEADLTSLKDLGYSAFFNCKDLRVIELGGGIENVGGLAFENTTWLALKDNEFVIIGSALYKYNGLAQSVTIPDGINMICDNAFYQKTSLVSINLAQSVLWIGANAFNGCSALENINLMGVTTIGEKAFYGCQNLRDIDLVNATLYDSAFYGCDSLTSIDLCGLSNISASAFEECINLEAVTLSEDVSIGSRAFYNCTKLTSLNNSSGITSVGSYAFYKTGLLTLKMENVQIIEEFAFSQSALTSVDLGDKLTEIKSEAFSQTQLVYVDIGSGIKNIGIRAFFWKPQSVAFIRIAATPAIYPNTFNNLSELYIYIDVDTSEPSVADLSVFNFSLFADFIMPYMQGESVFLFK